MPSNAIKMTEPCKNGHMSYRRMDNHACVECARDRSRKQHSEVRADVVKWAEFKKRMKEYSAKNDDDWHKKPSDIPLDKLSRRFRDSQRERYGISREQAAADMRLFRRER